MNKNYINIKILEENIEKIKFEMEEEIKNYKRNKSEFHQKKIVALINKLSGIRLVVSIFEISLHLEDKITDIMHNGFQSLD